MEVSSLASLLVLGLSCRQAGALSAAPSCVDDCTNTLADQISPVGRLQTLCDGVASQRALFQCLALSCHAHTYGPALGYVISACSGQGADISPLHPVEVLYATHNKRQVIPTEPGPVLPGSSASYNSLPTQPGSVLPGSSTLHSTQTLTLDKHLVMDLECRTGVDGLLTLSVNVPPSAATPSSVSNDGGLEAANAHGPGGIVGIEGPATQTLGLPRGSIVRNATTACASSTASTFLALSNTLVPAQTTNCPCHSQDSSSIPSPQLMSVSLLQSPIERQTTSAPSSTSSLVTTLLSGQLMSTRREDCAEASTLANTTAPRRAHLLQSPAAVTQILRSEELSDCSASVAGIVKPFPQTLSTSSSTSLSTFDTRTMGPASTAPLAAQNPCSSSTTVRATFAVTASPSWSLSVAGFSSPPVGHTGFSSAIHANLGTAGRETTSCSYSSASASLDQALGASATLAQVSASLLQVSASLHQLAVNASAAISSWAPLPLTSATLSTLTTSTSLPAPFDPTTAPPTYTVHVLPEFSAYFPPLAAYSYHNSILEYGNPSISTTSSSLVMPRLSTPTLVTSPAGISASRDPVQTSEEVLGLSSSFPELYGQGPRLSSSPSLTPLPVQMIGNAPSGFQGALKLRGPTLDEKEKRAADWSPANKSRSTSADETSGLEATSTAARSSRANTTTPLTTSHSTALVPSLAVVWTAVTLVLAAVGMTER